MLKRLVSPTALGGFGSIILTVAIFFAQGGFTNMNPWYVVGLVVGIGLIIYSLLKNTQTDSSAVQYDKVTNPLEDIKSDLVTMNMCEREVATNKAKQPCPKVIAMQIYDDFIALFGADIATFTMSLIQRVISNRDIDALIEFFKKFGDILDNNDYGLKIELENNELYKSSRTDLAQKRLKLKMNKKKKATIQKNMDRVYSLTYGLNSSILLRGALNSVPEAKRIVPAEIRVALEGIETATEKTLNAMLNDLENEWKVTINEMQIL